MKRAIALDTSGPWGSVALVEASAGSRPEVVAELGARIQGSHAPRLVGWIDRVLAEAGWVRGAVDLYVAVRGPGSFTGVRIGLGTVRGLSAATGRPAEGVSALEALAEAAGPVEGPRVPLIDAGRGEVYGARYDGTRSPPHEEAGPRVGSPEAVAHALVVAGAVVFGSGREAVRPVLLRAGASVRFAATPRSLAGAAGCLALCREPSGDLAPLYLRPPDARPQHRPV